ncbi:odorant receptor 94b-like isoform X2 [Diachasmimorpha longicaudata]|uniref:odorant receptor 94b-like isoform X2 n=1 Tax=Diachasmimorpha longicaudata TaxID=58733 RepID=UPI0030B90553
MLPYSFVILQVLGLCRSVNWQEGWKTRLYDCYTYIMLFLLYTNALFQTIYVFTGFKNIDTLIDDCFILLTTINSGFKATIFVRQRQEIVDLLRIYRSQMCVPRNAAEEFIRDKYDRVIQCVETSNDIFSATILGQYMASSFILCGTVYKVSKMASFDSALIGVLMYLACMLFDIFLPCYYGHKVTTASFRLSEGVYNMDWSALKIPTKKSLALIMRRCLKPLRFTSGYVVELSLDSFGGLIKTSYSIFNLLKQQNN